MSDIVRKQKAFEYTKDCDQSSSMGAVEKYILLL